MTIRKPLVLNGGQIEQIQTGDLIPPSSVVDPTAGNLILSGPAGGIYYPGDTVGSYTLSETTGTDSGFQSAINTALTSNILQNNKITIQLSSANYSLSNNYNYNNTDFSKVIIQGQAPIVTTASANTVGTQISGKQYYFGITLASVTGISVGDYIVIQPTQTGTYGFGLAGCWPITAVNTTTKVVTISVTSYYASSMTATTSLIANVYVFSTILTTSYGFSFTDCPGVTLSNVVLVAGSSAGSTTTAISAKGPRTSLSLTAVGAYNFQQYGLYSSYGSKIETDLTYGFSAGVCGNGMYLQDDSSFFGTFVIGGSGALGSCTGYGVNIQLGSYVRVNAASWATGGFYGVFGNVGARILVNTYPNYGWSGNSNDGLYLYNFSWCQGQSGWFSNVGGVSPSVNTTNNNGSYIFG